MATEWVIVAAEGYDAEEVDNPRSVTDTCPACERRVRLQERQMVKNFKMFSLPLLAMEQGARVFQCPHCEACFEPPMDDVPGADHDVAPGVRSERPGPTVPARDPRRLAELEESLIRAEDEVSLWQLRVDLANRKGATELATEARGLVDRYDHVAAGLRTELARLRGAPATAASAATAPTPGPSPGTTPGTVPGAVTIPPPPAPPERAPEPTAAEVDDEMAALKRKLRKRD